MTGDGKVQSQTKPSLCAEQSGTGIENAWQAHLLTPVLAVAGSHLTSSLKDS